MFYFAIVDDDKNDLNLVYNALKEHCDYHHIQFKVDFYNKSSDFNFNIYYDAIFLDIDMPDINGIELARKINEKSYTKIIFITNYNEYINIVFDVRPFHFIKKENIRMEMIKVLTILFKQLNKERIRLKTKRGMKNVVIDDIYYIKKSNDLTIIHTKDDEYDIWESIVSLYDTLKPYHIEKINQSTLINMKYIKQINHQTIILDNDFECKLSVRMKTNFIKIYEDYLLRNI